MVIRWDQTESGARATAGTVPPVRFLSSRLPRLVSPVAPAAQLERIQADLAGFRAASGEVATAISLVVHKPKVGSHQDYLVYQIYYACLATAALADAAITAATYYYIRKANSTLAPSQHLPAVERFGRTAAETNGVTYGLVVAVKVVMLTTKG